jgi:hypothetical protein
VLICFFRDSEALKLDEKAPGRTGGCPTGIGEQGQQKWQCKCGGRR